MISKNSNVSSVNINVLCKHCQHYAIAMKTYHHGNLKKELIKCACVMCERDGYTKLSIRSLAKESGVSQTAPYRHFETKEALYASVAQDGFNKLSKAIHVDVDKKVTAQLNSDVISTDNALGRVLNVYEENKSVDTDTLELKMAEAVFKETPELNKGLLIIKVISVVALDYFTNRISAGILLLTILFYVFVYTIWLKRRTPQNIVIGGAAGAFPPVIGWTIATGSLSIEPLTFFLIIFFWTPSHFWALSLYKSDDYKKANIPMLPLTNGVESTKINIFVYCINV